MLDRVFRGSVLVLDSAGEFRQLDGAAALVWILLDEPGDLAQIEARLHEAADLIGTVPRDGVEQAIEVLVANHVLDVTDAG